MGKSHAEIVHLLLAAAWRRRFVICVPMLLLPPIGFAVGKFAPKSYEVHTTILVQEPAKQNPYLDDLAVGTRLQERMPVLSSLARNSHSIAAVATELGRIWPAMPKPERDAIVRSITSGLTIQLIGADMVEFRLRSSDPVGLEALLDGIAKRFVEKLVGPERSSIASSVTFLEQQIEGRRALLTEAERRLGDFKARNADLLPEAHSQNVDRLAKARELLDERRVALEGVNAKIAELQASLAASDPVLDKIEDDLARLSAEAAQMRARYTSDHPTSREMAQRIAALEAERARLASRPRPSSAGGGASARALSESEGYRSARASQISLRVEIDQLERAIQRLQPLVADQSKVANTLSELERDVGSERKIFDMLVQRYEMARVTGDLGLFEADDRVKIIDPPDEPIGLAPAPLLFLVAGIVAGLALGFGLALTAELGDDCIRRRSDLERIRGLRALARFPRLPIPERTSGEDGAPPSSPPWAEVQPGPHGVAGASVHPLKLYGP